MPSAPSTPTSSFERKLKRDPTPETGQWKSKTKPNRTFFKQGGPAKTFVCRILPLLLGVYALVFAGVFAFPDPEKSGHIRRVLGVNELMNSSKGTTVDKQPPPSEDNSAQKESSSQVTPDEYEKTVLPNLLLIGAQHAGTAPLAEWLLENDACHPSLSGDEPLHFNKGIRYFDRKERFDQGPGFYTKRYQHCHGKKFIMDATPNTLPNPEHVEAVYREAGGNHLEKLKVVVILREPVTRELSLYNHKKYSFKQNKDRHTWFSDVGRNDGSIKPFEEYLDVVLDGMLPKDWGIGDMSLYAEHLKKWWTFVDRTNFLVISYEEFEKDHKKVDQRVRDFLGHDLHGSSKGVNDHPGFPSCFAQQKLNKVFEPMNQYLYELLKENPGPAAEQSPFPTFKQLKCTQEGWSNPNPNKKDGQNQDASMQTKQSLRVG